MAVIPNRKYPALRDCERSFKLLSGFVYKVAHLIHNGSKCFFWSSVKLGNVLF